MRVHRRILARAAVVLAAAACGGDGDSPPAEMPQPGAGPLPDEAPPMPAESLPMPEYPRAEPGRLVAVSAGPYELEGNWPARAARCIDPPMMEIHGLVPGEPGIGTLVLLQLPADDPVTTYPIVTVEAGAPQSPAAQIAVQDSRSSTARTFQGLEGTIELAGLTERVSGRFAVSLRELQTDDQAKYVGVFNDLPLEDLPSDYCRRYRESLVSPDSGSGTR